MSLQKITKILTVNHKVLRMLNTFASIKSSILPMNSTIRHKSSEARLTADPRICVNDVTTVIAASGLTPNSKFTVRAQATDDKNRRVS